MSSTVVVVVVAVVVSFADMLVADQDVFLRGHYNALLDVKAPVWTRRRLPNMGSPQKQFMTNSYTSRVDQTQRHLTCMRATP